MVTLLVVCASMFFLMLAASKGKGLSLVRTGLGGTTCKVGPPAPYSLAWCFWRGPGVGVRWVAKFGAASAPASPA